jgi:hypothetical protein
MLWCRWINSKDKKSAGTVPADFLCISMVICLQKQCTILEFAIYNGKTRKNTAPKIELDYLRDNKTARDCYQKQVFTILRE